MKNIFILSVLPLILIANSCQKNTPVKQVDAGLKAAFNFQPGTYWIYKDSISGKVDSFVVTGNQPGSGPDNGYLDYYINIFISEYAYDTSININAIQWEYSLNGNNFILLYYNSNAISNFGKSIDYSDLFSYPLSVGNSFGNADISNVTTATSFSLSIDGQTYSNTNLVNSILLYNNIYEYSFNNLFYIDAKIGFIKIVLNQPNDSLHRIWELQRYNVVL